MKIFFIKILIVMIIQAITSISYAKETGYEVELIIFEDTRGRYLHSEDWSYNDMLNNKQDNILKQVKADPHYKQLPWAGSKLASNLNKLKKNSNYRILANRRWKQKGLDREHAFNIPIESHSKVNSEKNNISATPQDADPYITGNVKLIMSRYLHFDVNIKYIRPQYGNNGKVENMVLPVVNERRMRSREIHYIDHPLVGIVVLATPFKIKSPKQNTDTTQYKTM